MASECWLSSLIAVCLSMFVGFILGKLSRDNYYNRKLKEGDYGSS